ncbi:MAG: FHA domain-containing protein, partial [Planctomycetota bacterium]
IDRTPLKTDSATADRSLAEWTLTDLHSLNGTFFKRSRLQIRDHAEVLIGGELLRFDLPEESDSLRITRIGPGRSEEKVTVAPGTAWIGADQAKCLPLLVGNTLLDPCHLRLDADRRGRWAITDLGSTNGLWVRIESSPLVDGDQWQCGEQRFAFTLP